MSIMRKRPTAAAFKANVALNAIKSEETHTQLASRYGVRPNLITKWKHSAVEGMAETFTKKFSCVGSDHANTVKVLHERIGQLLRGVIIVG